MIAFIEPYYCTYMYLRFMSENTNVFPALSPHITAAALSTSQLAPVLELRAAWDFLADYLTVDHDDGVAGDGEHRQDTY